ncbi:MAG TPA: isoprenylcysteine carboxylmethyltransferase family protein [Terriglobales bacterium]|nr:isoprenylcysteine carboxylmethyltransferase family protein [Terriglobales bacterium]
MSLIAYLGWIACCIYASIPSFWLVIHPRAGMWRTRKHQGKAVYKFLVPMWMSMWVALYLVTYPFRHVLLYRHKWTWLIAILFFAGGLFLYHKGRHGFSPLQLSGHHELEPDRHAQRLVIQGIRERVRHPIYLGHLLEMIGWSIGTGMLACWILTMFAVLTGIFMIRTEEGELVQRFGNDYREYQKRVPAIMPKF